MSGRPIINVHDSGDVEVFCGVDVAKAAHHVVALDVHGRRLVDKPLPKDEASLRALLTRLAQHGRLLVVVDQPASTGALTIVVARDMGIALAHLPGLTMRRVAQLYPGEDRTDARDAFIIADAARTLPHTLRRVGADEETVTALGVLAGFDADLAREATRLTNRLHDALLHVHPALERLLGKHFAEPGAGDARRGRNPGAAACSWRRRPAAGPGCTLAPPGPHAARAHPRRPGRPDGVRRRRPPSTGGSSQVWPSS